MKQQTRFVITYEIVGLFRKLMKKEVSCNFSTCRITISRFVLPGSVKIYIYRERESSYPFYALLVPYPSLRVSLSLSVKIYIVTVTYRIVPLYLQY